MSLQVGDRVWIFDGNRRIYIKGQSGPVFREHFRPLTIDAETRISWVLSDGRKINKKTLDGCYPTEESVDDACWIQDHSYRISEEVRRCRSAATLKQIASLVNWTPGSRG